MKTTAFETAFVRVPVAGYNPIADPDWAGLGQQFRDPAFLEALYLASPALHDEAVQLDFSRQPDAKTRRVVYSLLKYLSRAATRCTPFGLFGGFATLPVETTPTQVRIADTGALKRVVRLDMNYLCALAQDLEKHPDVKPHLRLVPNTSLYEANGEYRYVSYRYGDGGQRVHHLSSAEKSPYLDTLLEQARNGAPPDALVDALVSDEIPADDALDFVESVLDAQLLVSELEPSLTGADFLVQIRAQLATVVEQHPSAALAGILALLDEVQADLKAIETNERQPCTDALRAVEAKLSRLATPFDRKVLFQLDTHLPALTGNLNRGLLNKLIAKIPTLLKLSVRVEGPLAEFQRRFSDKYEDEEIPLVLALDPELGVGFPANQDPHDDSPLVEGLTGNPTTTASRTWTVQPQQAYLFQRVAEAQVLGAYEVQISEEDLHALNPGDDRLPPTNAAMFSVVREGGRELLLLDSFGGATGTALLGRFGHTDPAVRGLLQQISDAEDAVWPDAVFADVVHLPEARTGNVIIRPELKRHQIPYLGKASVPRERQLPVTDLLVSVRNGRVVLRSKSLDRVIVPRLANAHNYSNSNSLDIYHFLCALQHQAGRTYLGGGLGNAASAFVFVPRVVLDNLVLSEARWHGQARHVKPLVAAFKAGDWPALAAELARWREQYRIPRYVALVDFDNELFIDLENQWLAETFVNEIKAKDTFTLKEFLFRADNAVATSPGNWHTNQFVVAFRNEPVSANPQPRPAAVTPAAPVQRRFFTGSEWLYYKIYTGLKTADALLTDALYPLARRFEQQGFTDRFFFLRYGDPDHHLRIRFHLKNDAFLGDVVRELHAALQPYLANKSVTAVVNGTYNRELERYGSRTIEAVEDFFHRDSEAILRFLSLIEGAEGEQCRWRFGLKLTDDLLDQFGFDLKQKLEFAEQHATAFGREFGYNAALKKSLDERFKTVEPALAELLAEANDDHRFFYELATQRRDALWSFVNTVLRHAERGELEISLDALLGSLVHMTTNRLFRTRQRFVEFSLYYHLHKHYRTEYGHTVLARRPVPTDALACP